jgi:hypothetical protein
LATSASPNQQRRLASSRPVETSGLHDDEPLELARQAITRRNSSTTKGDPMGIFEIKQKESVSREEVAERLRLLADYRQLGASGGGEGECCGSVTRRATSRLRLGVCAARTEAEGKARHAGLLDGAPCRARR